MDIHAKEERVQTQRTKLKESEEVPKETKKLYQNFWKEHTTQHDQRQLSPLTEEKYLKAIRGIYEKGFIDKPLDTLTLSDMKTLINELKQSDYADSTIKYNYIRPLKKFYRRFKKDKRDVYESDKELRSAIEYLLEYSFSTNGDKNVTDEDILTKKEVKKILENTYNERDKAFIMLACESGARIGALLNVKIGDIDKETWQHGWVIKFTETKTETSEREAHIKRSIPYLENWLQNHPDSEKNKDSYLFTKLDENEGLSYRVGNYICKRAAKRADIDKNVTPHMFRRTAATWLYQDGWDITEIKDFIGWSRSSDIPVLRYIQKRQNSKEAVERHYGLAEKEEEKENIMENKTCLVCGETNEATRKECVNCMQPLNPEEAKKEKDIVEQLLDNPEKLIKLKQAMKEFDLDELKEEKKRREQ